MYSTPDAHPHGQPRHRPDYRPRRRGAAATVLLAAVTALAATGAGCQWRPKQKPVEPTSPPMAVDEAMQYRQWDLTSARWADTSMEGWPTRFPYTYETNAGRRQYAPYVLDTAAFLYQFFRLPFTYIKDRPFAPKTFTAVEYEPSYTGIGRFMPESGAYVIDRGSGAGQSANATDTSSGTPGDSGGTAGAGTAGTATPGAGDAGTGAGTGTSGVPGGRPTGGTGAPGGAGGVNTGSPGSGGTGGAGGSSGAGGGGAGGGGT